MNRTNNPGCWVRCADPAPEQGPHHYGPEAETPPCYDCGRLRNYLRHAHKEIANWNQWYQSTSHRIHNTKSSKIIAKKDSEISDLKLSLQIKTEEADNIMDFWKKECKSMTAKWEAEKEKLLAASEQKEQMLLAKLQIQDDCLEKVQQLEEQLKQRDADMLALRKEKEDLSERLMDSSNQLSKQTELLQSEKTWQIKCDALEEYYTKEQAEREDSWEARVKKREEQMNELCLKKNKKQMKCFWSRKKAAKTEIGLNEAGQREVKEANSKRDDKDEIKTEKEKKKKGFWSWMPKKKRCDSDSQVEEAAGCSAEQQ